MTLSPTRPVVAGVLLAVESLGFAAFLTLAIAGAHLGLLVSAVGFGLHALWDMAHHGDRLPTRVPRWYPPCCATWDIVVGIGAAVLALT